MKAIWNGKIIAESNKTIGIENNRYFPADSANKEYLENSDNHTTCPWKGEASYFNIIVDGKTNPNAAWYYPNPKTAAKEIKNYIAYWKGVEILS